MKKLPIVAFVAMSVAFSLRADRSADVLVWDVNTDGDSVHFYDGATRNFDTIKFWAIDSDKNEVDLTGVTYMGPEFLLSEDPEIQAEGRSGSNKAISTGEKSKSAGTFYTDLSDYTDGQYTFMAELLLAGSTVDRMLTPLTWNDIKKFVVADYVETMIDSYPLDTVTPYNMASTMVPEPTSGLLLLFGGALLALRRRRVA